MALQLSVFLQNKSGKIATITKALHEADIDIRALSIADTTDFGILRMLVSDVQKAKDALSKQNCIVSVNEVTIVAVPDVPGSLSRILDLLAKGNIDIEYMYSLFAHGETDAYMVFRVSDGKRLNEVLDENGISTVPPEKLGLS